MFRILFSLTLLFKSAVADCVTGKLVNPFTDVCWECLFPITVSGVNVTPGHRDLENHAEKICICAGLPPKVGIPLTFWEPTRLVDVTRHAYKLLAFGGISVGKENIKNRGCIGIVGDGPSQQSFYHVHWYTYPIFTLMELFTDFVCLEKGDLDMAYMSELDPLWNDEQMSRVLNPEAAVFGNPLAQMACIADCAAATSMRPLDELFWCAGCSGSLYPFSGTVCHHIGAIQASYLLVHRIIAKLHRSMTLKGYEPNEFCEAKYMPIIKKSLYKTQLLYPIAQSKGPCQPLGSSSVVWGSGKSFPYDGEDFVYLIWTKKQCCLDAVPVVSGANL